MSSLGYTNTSMAMYTNISANKVNFRGVRKGPWTGEEDNILRNCIEKYGEGHWHRIPLRTGLNRCRKSCRLRWMNYLKPNIKRGEFDQDEVDLILRLHNLLGNRWSLIAGRIPGRTANDVKNYWNTNRNKKSTTSSSLPPKHPNPTFAKLSTTKNIITLPTHQIIRPKPQTFTKSSSLVLKKPDPVVANLGENVSGDNNEDENVNWWENLLEMHDEKEDNERFNRSSHDQPTNHSSDVDVWTTFYNQMPNIWEDENLESRHLNETVIHL